MAVNNKITLSIVVIVLLLSAVLIAGCTSVSTTSVQPVQTGPMLDENGKCVVVHEDHTITPCTEPAEQWVARMREAK